MADHTHQTHILIAEDELSLLDGLRDLLSMRGYRVTGAQNGAAALARLEELPTPPDLIISDIHMPVMDGYEFLQQVRNRIEWITIPFIFLTAHGEREDIHRGFVLGAEDYVTKPFDFEALVSRIETRLERREQMLAAQESKVEQLRKRILNVINHELRTPLSYIVAYTDLMATSRTAEQSTELQQYINGILTGTDRLSRLVERFLLLAELESGTGYTMYQRRAHPIEDVGLVITEAVANVAKFAEKRQVTIHTELDGNLPCVFGDTVYLEVALRQLLDNAVKFSEKANNATVTLTLSTTPDELTITVRDYGRGLDADEIENIFSMFYQANREEFEQQGIGAGLAIVKHVMRMHGGRVEVRSVPQQGSTFSLHLPVC